MFERARCVRRRIPIAAIPAAAWVVLTFHLVTAPCVSADPLDGPVAPAHCLLCPAERAVRFGYGSTDRGSLDFYTVGPRLAFDLPAAVPPIAGNRLRLAVELLGSVIDDGGTTGEVAFTPLLLDYRFDRGQRIVPYVEGGEGIALTWLRGLQLGGTFQFTSQVGGGIHVFVRPTLALTFGYRLRHISNAGLRSDNRGLNTQFLIVGFSSFPSRR